MTIVLWAVLFLLLSIGFALVAYSGVAIAISFISKFFFFFAFIFLIISIFLFIIERYQLKRSHQRTIEEHKKVLEEQLNKVIGSKEP